MDKLRKTVRTELSENDIDLVAGGALRKQTTWTCPYCGATMMAESTRSAQRHMEQECSNNPYK